MPSKRILALDMASHTGWAFQDRAGRIETGVALFLGTLNPGDRWKRFHDWLGWYAVDLVVYEEPFVHASHKQGYGLGYGFEAILQLFCAQQKIRCVGVNAAHLKKWATGRGNADKFAMLKFARSMGWEMSDDNEVDARWLLEYARERIVKSKGAA